jgi:hypothetical protein
MKLTTLALALFSPLAITISALAETPPKMKMTTEIPPARYGLARKKNQN